MNARDDALVRARHRAQADLLIRRAGGVRRADGRIVYPLRRSESERFPDPRPVFRVECPVCRGLREVATRDGGSRPCTCDRGFVTVVERQP